MLVALILSVAWLVMSIYGYHSNKDQVKWATKMFVFPISYDYTILNSYCVLASRSYF